LPIAPVRANVRGTRDDQAICTLTVSPGATGTASGTSATVRSSRLPSSGAMKRSDEVTSTGAPVVPTSFRLVTSIQPQSPSGRRVSSVSPARAASRIQVERVLRHAL
jgi:hypothetical protein